MGDIRFGSRWLAQRPAFTVLAVAALGLGIGGTTAMFSVVHGVLLRALPFRDPERLVMLWEKNPPRNRNFVSEANFLDWRAQTHSFEQMGAARDVHVNVAGGAEAAPEEVPAERVSASLLPLLGVSPALGRAFRGEEDQPGAAHVVLLGFGFWQRRFGGDRSALGRTLRLNGEPHTIIGVLPADFELRRKAQLWTPLALDTSEDYRATGGRTLSVVGRLRPGVPLAAAAAEMDSIAARLEHAHPAFNAGWRVTVLSVEEELVGDVRPGLLALLAGTGILLLMACTNVANLLLARAAARRREMAIRAAAGASHARLLRQLLTESVLLAAIGGMVGLALAVWATRLLTALSPAEIPRLRDVNVDAAELLFTFAVAAAAGVLFGFAPALHVCGGNLQSALREGARGLGPGRGRRRAQRLLAITQIALAGLLLTSAGLIVRSFLRLRRADPGLDSANVLTMKVPLAGGPNQSSPRRVAFFQQLLRRVEALPGVDWAGAISSLPLDGFGAGVTFAVQGQPMPRAGEKPAAVVRITAGNYFRALRIPLRQGRWFTEQDGAGAPRVALVNETLAHRHLGGTRAALGTRLWLDLRPPVAVDVVGVVGDVKSDRLASETWPTIYGPHAQMPAPTLSLAIRSAGDAARLAPEVTAAVAALDRDQPVANVRPMKEILSRSMAEERFYAVLVAVFAAVALALAATGVYGVVACQVSERVHEIGVRLAVGGTRGRVLARFLGEGARLTVAGIGLGAAAAVPLARMLPPLLSGTAAEPATFLASALLLAAISLVATWFPARRAAALDPAAALRHE